MSSRNDTWTVFGRSVAPQLLEHLSRPEQLLSLADRPPPMSEHRMVMITAATADCEAPPVLGCTGAADGAACTSPAWSVSAALAATAAALSDSEQHTC